MTDLEKYVDELFRHQPLTNEVRDLKEEILSNMTAKRDDLIAQGFSEEEAAEKAVESLSSIDSLIDGNQLTYADKYRTDCSQAALLGSIVFWILSMPLLFTCYAPLSYLGLFLTIASGAAYLRRRSSSSAAVSFISVAASKKRQRTVWIIWGLFFAVYAAAMVGITFGSNIWFHRPVSISGPYELANIAVRFYLPLITIVLPITCQSFTRLLIMNVKEV